VWPTLTDLLDGFNPIHLRYPQIHEDSIGLEFTHDLKAHALDNELLSRSKLG
jgi:hypothetical protein